MSDLTVRRIGFQFQDTDFFWTPGADMAKAYGVQRADIPLRRSKVIFLPASVTTHYPAPPRPV